MMIFMVGIDRVLALKMPVQFATLETIKARIQNINKTDKVPQLVYCNIYRNNDISSIYIRINLYNNRFVQAKMLLVVPVSRRRHSTECHEITGWLQTY